MMWARLLAGVATAFFLVWFCGTRKRDVIETHETNARMIGALVVTGLMCLWLAICAYLSGGHHLTAGWGFWALPLAAPFVLPIILVPHSYFGLERSLKHRYGVRASSFDMGATASWQTFVDELSGRLGLSSPPKVAIVQDGWGAPIVFGRSARRAILAVPSRFEQILVLASDGKPEIERGLTELAILHELAHVRNRDVAFASWLQCFLRALTWAVSLLLPYLLLVSYLEPNRKGIGPTCVFLVVCFGTLVWLTKSFRRYRELLADARASLCVERARLLKLLETEGTEAVSPFEALMVMCATSRALRPPARQEGRRASLEIIWARVQRGVSRLLDCPLGAGRARHKGAPRRLKARASALRSQMYVGSGPLVPTFEAAFGNGLVGGAGLVLSLMVILIWNPLADVGRAAWLLATAASPLSLWVGYGAVLYVAYLYSLPLRNSIGTSAAMGVYVKKLLSRYCVGAVSGTGLFLAVTAASRGPGSDATGYCTAATLSLGFYTSAFLVSWIFSFVLLGADEWATYYRRQEAMSVFSMLPAALILVALFLVLGRRVGWLPAFAGIAIGLLATMFLHAAFPLDGHPVDRWLRFDFPMLRKVFGRDTIERYTFWAWNALIVLLLSVPTVVATVVFGLLLKLHGDGDAMVPDLILYLVLLALLSSLCMAFYITRSFVSHRPTGTLRVGQMLSAALSAICVRPDAADRAGMRRLLCRAERREGGFSTHARIPAANMDTTWTGLACLSSLGMRPAYQEEHVRWILTCENREGGFAPLPGLSPRLSSTFYALSSLSILGSLEMVDPMRHSRWVWRWQAAEGWFRGPHSGWHPLPETYFAVGALDALDDVERINRESCATWAMHRWRKTGSTHEGTYYLVQILNWLGKFRKEWAEEIRRKYLLPYAPLMVNLHIEKHPAPAFYYASSAAIVSRGNAPCIAEETGQFVDRLAETFTLFVRRSVEMVRIHPRDAIGTEKKPPLV